MAAYASLVSLMHIIDQIQHHPRPPITLATQQAESLTKTITFLQEFLESNNGIEEGLMSRIVDAANAAEDTIESHIVDQILAGSTSHGKKRISSVEFSQSLDKVIQNLDLIKEEVGKMEAKMETFAPSNPSPSMGKNSPMVGFDDISYQMRDKLIQSKDSFQVISVVGMAGIGKTTLARSIFLHQGVAQHFDLLAWTTISQEYNLRKILVELLHENEDRLSYMDEHDLADTLHRKLKGRRYLIVMDDIWDIEVWDRLKFFFPNDKNGSRVIITTRLSNLVSQITNNVGLNMTFLDEDKSWELFSITVFGSESCPLELKEVGKSIVRNCRGLPLSIVVVGGLLAKSKPTQEYWESIAENLNSVVNSEDDERSLKILHMSYTHLPVHLKSCFLYMGVFREDSELRFAMLVKLWVAEGFLKPVRGKTLEEIAEDCIKDLIDRNLVLVHELGSTDRNIKYCKIHDLLRDLSLREAQKERFYHVIKQHNPNPPQSQRIVIPQSITTQCVTSLSTPLVRSLICDINGNLQTLDFRLLRVFESFGKYSVHRLYSLHEMFMFINSRYLAVRLRDSDFPSSIYSLWNLHTLIVHNDSGEEECNIKAPVEIWDMPQLRHIDVGSLYLTNPSKINGRDCTMMPNLHTLKRVMNFKCGDEVVRRIPNIKKLSLEYREFEDDGHHLNNLDRLTLLECFSCYVDLDSDSSRVEHILQSLTFPKSLNKLKIGGVDVYWETLIRKLGFLNIQVLKLMHGCFRGQTWETVDGQFQNLRFLIVEDCEGLEMWESKSWHFPRLKRIVLRLLRELKEIPLGFAKIDTLQSIELAHCNEALIVSAKRLLEEQEEFSGVESTEVQVYLTRKSEVIESLATPKFQVRYLRIP